MHEFEVPYVTTRALSNIITFSDEHKPINVSMHTQLNHSEKYKPNTA